MSAPTEIPLWDNVHYVAKWIWHNLVPKSGQCDTVQGELLRAVEKLSWDAQNNGNVNWDSGFEMLLDFLEQTLCNEPQVPAKLKLAIRKDLDLLRDYERPYTDDDLYERLTEAVIGYCRLHPQLISRSVNPRLKR